MQLLVHSKFCNAFITLGLLLKINFQAVVDFSVAKATLQSQLEIIILHHSLFINLHSSFLHFATFKLFSLFYQGFRQAPWDVLGPPKKISQSSPRSPSKMKKGVFFRK